MLTSIQQVCFVTWIPRIPFSVVMLQQTMDVASMYFPDFIYSLLYQILSQKARVRSVQSQDLFSESLLALKQASKHARLTPSSETFGHVFLVSAIGGIASVAFGAWYSLTLVSGKRSCTFNS